MCLFSQWLSKTAPHLWIAFDVHVEKGDAKSEWIRRSTGNADAQLGQLEGVFDANEVPVLVDGLIVHPEGGADGEDILQVIGKRHHRSNGQVRG